MTRDERNAADGRHAAPGLGETRCRADCWTTSKTSPAGRSLPRGQAELRVSPDREVNGPAMRLDFDFHGGGGFVVARKAVLRWRSRRAIPSGFDIRGSGPRNTFRVQAGGCSNRNVWRYRAEDFAVSGSVAVPEDSGAARSSSPGDPGRQGLPATSRPSNWSSPRARAAGSGFGSRSCVFRTTPIGRLPWSPPPARSPATTRRT